MITRYLIENSDLENDPYKHVVLKSPFLSEEISGSLLNWFENEAPWKLVVADFYEQYEFDLLNVRLPNELKDSFSKKRILNIIEQAERAFQIKLSSKIDITAHKLISSQIIKIHNDYRPGHESHRLIIQLNRGWTPSNGGLLMIFSEKNNSFELKKAINPSHNSAFAFEISPTSFHAVSEVNKGERYTLVISFYRSQYD